MQSKNSNDDPVVVGGEVAVIENHPEDLKFKF